MKGCKTIPEFVIKKWMKDNGFVLSEFLVEMSGNTAKISDKTGDSMEVYYNPEHKSVEILD